MIQALPVIRNDIFVKAKNHISKLLATNPNLPNLPMIRPFLHESLDHAIDWNSKAEWSLVIFLPTRESYFVTSKGALLHNWNLVKPECTLWKGSVLGVQRFQHWWNPVDAYVLEGQTVYDLPYEQRLAKIRQFQQSVPADQTMYIHSGPLF